MFPLQLSRERHAAGALSSCSHSYQFHLVALNWRLPVVPLVSLLSHARTPVAMAALPLAKILSLTVRTVAKPLSRIIKVSSVKGEKTGRGQNRHTARPEPSLSPLCLHLFLFFSLSLWYMSLSLPTSLLLFGLSLSVSSFVCVSVST